jgi:methylated-DNA-[protein]-cysteine S-methyltransferase
VLTTIILTPLGGFRVWADEYGLCRLMFPDKSKRKTLERQGAAEDCSYPVFLKTGKQLSEYFRGERQTFNLPLSIQGTEFQQAVWNLLIRIPYGSTTSYGQLAEQLGNKNKARAVGGAAHVNPLPVIIPCHRLIGTNGKLTGFAGGLKIKKNLLNLEAKANEK